MIKRLKQNHYHVYALSNTHTVVYEYVKNLDVGKDFDGYIISAIEKMMKPNEDIYLQLFKKYGLNPEECFFVDDSEKNVMTAKSLGMQGHIFNNKNYMELEEELKNSGVFI